MFGTADLKQHIEITETTVECPVRDCTRKVARQRKRFTRAEDFKCCDHGIYISPSTFEYDDELSNLLWKTPDDLDVLTRIKTAKREKHRFARDNSEDAMTWNVFRYLERKRLLGTLLSSVCGGRASRPHAVYWSYSQVEGGPWQDLLRARLEFGEARSLKGAVRRGSEPDMIVLSEDNLFFIEAKLKASNNTSPHSPSVRDGYTNGGGGWWSTVFGSDFDTVAIAEKKYELARFWLIGTWLAKEIGVGFFLITLVPSWHRERPERTLAPHIRQGEGRRILRLTWEGIHRYVSAVRPIGGSETSLLGYLGGKTVGYDRRGDLKRALDLT